MLEHQKVLSSFHIGTLDKFLLVQLFLAMSNGCLIENVLPRLNLEWTTLCQIKVIKKTR